MREAGIAVNDVPKIHIPSPSKHDHAITLDDPQLVIPLQLRGIFSGFPSRMPTMDEIETLCPILLTPDSDQWNPHLVHFAEHEASFLDWEGNVQQPLKRTKYLWNDMEHEMDDIAVNAFCTSAQLPLNPNPTFND